MLIRFIDQDFDEEIINVNCIQTISAVMTDDNPEMLETHFKVYIELKRQVHCFNRRYYITANDWSRLWSKTSGRRDDIWCISMHVLDRDLQMVKENEARHELQLKK